MKCKKCEKDMHEIPQVADLKLEGQANSKWDGNSHFQCTNVDCEQYEKIVTVHASESS